MGGGSILKINIPALQKKIKPDNLTWYVSEIIILTSYLDMQIIKQLICDLASLARFKYYQLYVLESIFIRWLP